MTRFIFLMGFHCQCVCSSRALGSKLFKEQAEYGHCASKKITYYGFQGLITINFSGVISAVSLTSANVDERDVLWEVTEKILRLLIGDKGFIRPLLKQELATIGIDLTIHCEKI